MTDSSLSRPARDPIQDPAKDSDPPHVCNDGWVTIGQIGYDPETGEEVEEFSIYLCKRCQEGEKHGS